MRGVSRRFFLEIPLLFSLAVLCAPAPETIDEAARELARKIAAIAGSTPVTITVRNLTRRSGIDLAQLRRSLEKALRSQGTRVAVKPPAGTEVVVTLSENWQGPLLVAEIRRGEERSVTMAPLGQTAAPGGAPAVAKVVLDKRLLWEQQDQILDAEMFEGGLLVLDAVRVSFYSERDGQFELRQSAPLPGRETRPRDLRGRLQISGEAFQAYLPGLTCAGRTQPALELECKDGADWPLDSGKAAFAIGRNFFDGDFVMDSGQRKKLPPFFAAARIDEQGKALWIMAGVDERAHLYNDALEPAGVIAGWGSDIVAVESQCGRRRQVLATTAGNDADAVQAFEIVDRQPAPVSAPVEFSGPVTALWASRIPGTATAVARDLSTGRYAAYRLAISCGH